jgi:hypothetical protein
MSKEIQQYRYSIGSSTMRHISEDTLSLMFTAGILHTDDIKGTISISMRFDFMTKEIVLCKHRFFKKILFYDYIIRDNRIPDTYSKYLFQDHDVYASYLGGEGEWPYLYNPISNHVKVVQQIGDDYFIDNYGYVCSTDVYLYEDANRFLRRKYITL